MQLAVDHWSQMCPGRYTAGVTGKRADGADPRLEAILTALCADGGRATVQRRIVVSALLAGPRHVTAEELAVTVAARQPDITTSPHSLTLAALGQQGVAQHAPLGH